MNTKLIFAVTATVTFVAGIVGTHFVSKTIGKKEAVNTLRNEQLTQASDECNERRSIVKAGFKGDFADLQESYVQVDAWYAEEQRVINEMYDEIINNL